MNDRSTLIAAEEAPPDPGSEVGRLRKFGAGRRPRQAALAIRLCAAKSRHSLIQLPGHSNGGSTQ
jgi:hypothetical protein